MKKGLETAFAFILVAAGAFAQNMEDTSSVYSDAWGSDGEMVGFGSVDGSMQYHSYSVTVLLTSPSGRSANAFANYTPGYVSTSTSLPYAGEYGNYNVDVWQSYHCSQTSTYATISSRRISATVALATTGFKWPIIMTNQRESWCHYGNLDCDEGTARCISGDWYTFRLPYPNCPNRIIVDFIRVVVLGRQSCFAVWWDELLPGTPSACS